MKRLCKLLLIIILVWLTTICSNSKLPHKKAYYGLLGVVQLHKHFITSPNRSTAAYSTSWRTPRITQTNQPIFEKKYATEAKHFNL